MVASFYSYKGGVGRSQLVANLAAYFCYHQKKKVLLIDWDLEAPGLHFYFGKKYKDISCKGLIDLFQDYIKLRRKGVEIQSAEELPKFTNDYVANLLTFEKGRIDLIPAGQYVDLAAYKATCIDFDWYEFYEVFGGKRYIEYLKMELKKLDYDFIFIDSRTGLNDYSNICNIQFPDVNIAVVAPTQQNIEGCAAVMQQVANSPYITEQKYREGIIMPIYSRVQFSNDVARDEDTIGRFEKAFGQMIQNNFIPYLSLKKNSKLSVREFLDRTIISYEPSISLWENLVFAAPTLNQIFSPFAKKYIEIAELVRDLDLHTKSKDEKNTVLDLSGLGLEEIPPLPKNLTKLNLSNNKLTTLKGIEQLVNLVELDISGNQISDLSLVAHLRNLQKLDSSNNQILDISWLQGLTNLKILQFSGNQVSDISVLRSLNNLSRLFFSYNQVSDISALQGLRNLELLDFYSNQVTDIVGLQELTKLKLLGFNNNQVSDISCLQNLTELEVLFFRKNQVSDISCLQKLTQLIALNFSSNQVSDISSLQGLTNLKDLYFYDNPIFLLLPKEWQEKYTGLENQIEALQYWFNIRESVFVSFSWKPQSHAVVEEIQQVLASKNIAVIKDKNVLGYKGNTDQFMKLIKHNKAIIAVISKDYLESENCMKELLYIWKNGDVHNRFIPIYLDNADIHKAHLRANYTKYWIEAYKSILESAKDTVNIPQEDVKLYRKIAQEIGQLMIFLQKYNAFTVDIHRENQWQIFLEQVQKRS